MELRDQCETIASQSLADDLARARSVIAGMERSAAAMQRRMDDLEHDSIESRIAAMRARELLDSVAVSFGMPEDPGGHALLPEAAESVARDHVAMAALLKRTPDVVGEVWQAALLLLLVGVHPESTAQKVVWLVAVGYALILLGCKSFLGLRLWFVRRRAKHISAALQ